MTLIYPGDPGQPAMPLLKEAVPMGKELQHLPPGPLSWFLPSLFAAFNVVLLVVFSGLFFAFP